LRRSSIIRGRLFTRKKIILLVSIQLIEFLPSFGSYSSSIGAHCLALRESSLENLTRTLSINGCVISQKPSRSLSSGVGSPADVGDFDYWIECKHFIIETNFYLQHVLDINHEIV
jgi:hypothetical protein